MKAVNEVMNHILLAHPCSPATGGQFLCTRTVSYFKYLPFPYSMPQGSGAARKWQTLMALGNNLPVGGFLPTLMQQFCGVLHRPRSMRPRGLQQEWVPVGHCSSSFVGTCFIDFLALLSHPFQGLPGLLAKVNHSVQNPCHGLCL